MRFENIDFEVENGLAHLTLNRPEAANSLNLELARELRAAATRCENGPGIRAVLLTGAGQMFSAGGDLRSIAEAEKLARSLASGPSRTFGATKKLLLASADSDLETQLEAESNAIVAATDTRDGREGIRAFLEKRKPTFSGE